MSNKKHNYTKLQLPNRVVAYASNCSVDMVRKVKAKLRKDNYRILENHNKITEFLENLRNENLNDQ